MFLLFCDLFSVLYLSHFSLYLIVSCDFLCHVDRFVFFFFKQKTAYEMRISDWSSDVCSSDLLGNQGRRAFDMKLEILDVVTAHDDGRKLSGVRIADGADFFRDLRADTVKRSEEHTSELQSLMRISYAVFCLQTKKIINTAFI